MGTRRDKAKEVVQNVKVVEGFNDSRGEVSDIKDIPKNNGQNVNNDSAHLRQKPR